MLGGISQLALSGMLGLAAIVSLIAYSVNGGLENVQGDYQSAAAGEVLAVNGAVITGAILTPIGEEFFFRDVLTSGLLRFGPWIGVIGSAAVFALAHGINPVVPVAFIVGIISGVPFHRTGSVRPGVVVHAFNKASAASIPMALVSLVG